MSDLQVVAELLHDRRLSTAQVAGLLQTTEAGACRKLSRMVERGLVEPRGEGGGRTHHLAAGVYRALRESAAYVRVRGFEPLQQEQMVSAYVDAHGRITRGEAAELCALSPSPASQLLQRLVGRGELALVGERRSACYQRPSHN